MKNKKIILAMGLLLMSSSIIGCQNNEDKLIEDVKSLETSKEPTYDTEKTPDFENIEFENETLDEKEFSSDEFKDFDLTIVNIWGTWCSPCVAELPELQKIYEEYEGMGVNVVGIVTDTKIDGKKDNDTIALAKKIAEKTKVKYPLTIPDDGEFSDNLNYLQAYPTTIFVDKNGKIVGEPVMGAQNYEAWKNLVDSKLNEVKN